MDAYVLQEQHKAGDGGGGSYSFKTVAKTHRRRDSFDASQVRHETDPAGKGHGVLGELRSSMRSAMVPTLRMKPILRTRIMG